MTTLVLLSVVQYLDKRFKEHYIYAKKKKIQEWWTRKNENYLKNHAKRNMLSLTQARTRFFTETHEKFFEVIPAELIKFLQIIHDQTLQPGQAKFDAQTLK